MESCTLKSFHCFFIHFLLADIRYIESLNIILNASNTRHAQDMQIARASCMFVHFHADSLPKRELRRSFVRVGYHFQRHLAITLVLSHNFVPLSGQ